ncbi:MAG: phosphonate metabolism transcriptional regulator PhnF [Rhizobiaceae bacterium]
MIERGTGIAVWRQIAGRLRRDIAEGVFEPSGKIPNELDLAAELGVNRHTVRRAISELTEEGLLQARRGEGTFVTRERLSYPLTARTRFHEIATGQARVPHGTLVAHETVAAGDHVAARLDCAPGTPLLRLETLYLADDEPISTAVMWFDAGRFPNLVEDFRRCGSLTEAMKGGGVETYSRDRTEIHARPANEAEIMQLKLPADAVVLVTEYVSRDQDGTPAQYAHTSFAADRIRLFAGGSR